jgi:hypothetical protein
MYVRTIPIRGVPARGSVQDRIAGEMLAREQRRAVHGHVYLGRLLSATMAIPPKLFDMWTTLYTMEVTHESYSPGAIKDKERVLHEITVSKSQSEQQQKSVFSKLDSLTVEDADLRPVTPAELENMRRKMRRRHLLVRTPDGQRVPIESVRAASPAKSAPAKSAPAKPTNPKRGK